MCVYVCTYVCGGGGLGAGGGGGQARKEGGRGREDCDGAAPDAVQHCTVTFSPVSSSNTRRTVR